MQLSFNLGEDRIQDILFENKRHYNFLLIVETGKFFFFLNRNSKKMTIFIIIRNIK